MVFYRFLLFVAFIELFFSPQLAFAATWSDAFEQHNVVMLLVRSSDGKIVRTNQAARRFYGYSETEFQSLYIQDINVFSAKAIAEERALAAKEHRNFFVFKHRLKNGDVRTVEVSSLPVQYQNQTVLYSIIRDISEYRVAQQDLWHYQNSLEQMVEEKTKQLEIKRHQQIVILSTLTIFLSLLSIAFSRQIFLQKQAEKLLQIEKKRLSDVIWGTNVGTWELSEKSDNFLINERFATILGYTLEELTPLTPERLGSMCHPDDWEKSQQIMKGNIKGELEFYECELRIRHKQGHWIWIMSRGRVVKRDKRTSRALKIAGTHQEITLQKQLHEELDRLAHIDPLTQLPNRRYFHDRLDKVHDFAVAKNTMYAIFYIDLNKFKLVNDSYGHHEGDLVLKNVANKMTSFFRSSDLIFRLGGDEFVVIIENLKAIADVEIIATKLVTQLSKPHTLANGVSVDVPPSIGISVFPSHGSEVNILIQRADEMMYLAKGRYPEGGYEIYSAKKLVRQQNERSCAI